MQFPSVRVTASFGESLEEAEVTGVCFAVAGDVPLAVCPGITVDVVVGRIPPARRV